MYPVINLHHHITKKFTTDKDINNSSHTMSQLHNHLSIYFTHKPPSPTTI